MTPASEFLTFFDLARVGNSDIPSRDKILNAIKSNCHDVNSQILAPVASFHVSKTLLAGLSQKIGLQVSPAGRSTIDH